MIELILPILFKFAPFILAGLGALALYFGVKRKGKLEERARWEDAQAAFKREAAKRQAEAVSNDQDIDKRVKEKVDEIKKAVDHSGVDGNKFRF